jgi:hypothetical protein
MMMFASDMNIFARGVRVGRRVAAPGGAAAAAPWKAGALNPFCEIKNSGVY